MALCATAPVFVGLRAAPAAKTVVAAPQQVRAVSVVARASFAENLAKAAVVAGVSLAVSSGALAATVKMGADDGSLVFSPSSVSVSAGESVTWVNNAGFPHNVVFDEDAVPGGVDAGAISHEDYFNAPGETYSVSFDKAGTYEYYCEPHVGAGMAGKVVVS